MRYIFDSFAMLALLWDEPGAERVEHLLHDRRHQHWMSVINLGEVYYRTMREEDEDAASMVMRQLAMLPVSFVDADRRRSIAAATVKAAYPISYADCFTAALAREMDAAVVTGDPEFESLERDGVIRVEWVTRKRAR